MTAPVVGPVTQEVYDGLPEVYRVADDIQSDGPDGYPLLRYLSTLLDQLSIVYELIARFDYSDDPTGDGTFGSGSYGDGTYGGVAGPSATADLIDPETANAAWLPWLAQLLGVALRDGMTPQEQRDAMADPSATWAHSTPPVLTALALTVVDSVEITPHYAGQAFNIGIGTNLIGGVDISTWGALHAAAPTWGQLATVGSGIDATTQALLETLEPERPAGYKFTRYNA